MVGYDTKKKPVTAEDLKVAGAMAVIMKEAINPNIVQTIEHTPCFIHAASFGSVGNSSSSVISEIMASKLSEYVVTECDFGSDLGAEKYFNIKCRKSGLKPAVAVIVCSVRALKIHSGDFAKKGEKAHLQLKGEDLSAVDRGCSNLEKQVENLRCMEYLS